jgi:DNA-binding Lrp family transcriptional regulator
MPIAFVLINAEIGSEGEVLEKLREEKGIKEAYSVYGVYDIIAKVEAGSIEKLKDLVTWRIRKLDKVRSTVTMIVIDVMATPNK